MTVVLSNESLSCKFSAWGKEWLSRRCYVFSILCELCSCPWVWGRSVAIEGKGPERGNINILLCACVCVCVLREGRQRWIAQRPLAPDAEQSSDIPTPTFTCPQFQLQLTSCLVLHNYKSMPSLARWWLLILSKVDSEHTEIFYSKSKMSQLAGCLSNLKD